MNVTVPDGNSATPDPLVVGTGQPSKPGMPDRRHLSQTRTEQQPRQTTREHRPGDLSSCTTPGQPITRAPELSLGTRQNCCGLRGSTHHLVDDGSSTWRCGVERLSEREKEEIARLSGLGLPSRLIGAQIGRHHRTVWGHNSRLRHPALVEPTRSALRLSLDEREEISRGLAGGESLRVISRRLRRASSTISREVAANGGRRRYRACRADKAALRRMRRPKRSKLVLCPRLRDMVEAKLEVRWSPQQISGWLVEQFPNDPEMRVSHETI
jgi:hypothetical protein